MSTGIDQFRPEAGERMPPPARRVWTRVLLPAALVAAAGWLVVDAGWSAWTPRTEVAGSPVTVRTVELGPGESPAAGGDEVVVQAPGWVEAAPFATYVSALTAGVVEDILVLEGDSITAGQPVASLVDDDARIAVGRAEAELRAREAALARAEALAEAAATDLRELVSADRRVAVATAEVARLEAVIAGYPARIATLDATLRETRDEYERKRRLVEDGAVAEGPVVRLGHRIEGLVARIEAVNRELAASRAELDAAAAESTAADRDRALLVRERAAAQTADADRDAAAAAVATARADLDDARLRLDRCTIVSPVDGVVIERLTTVGSNVAPGPPQHSAHVVHVYDPRELQVRADVPLADAARVGVGQQAEIVVDLLPDTVFRGEVVRFVHRADLAKNTVEAKVRIDDPSPLLKPDMLARVRILAVAATDDSDAEVVRTASRVFVPRRALDGDAVWVVADRDGDLGVARRRTIEPGDDSFDDSREDWVEIEAGLSPGDVVLFDRNLRPGQAVRVVEAGDETGRSDA